MPEQSSRWWWLKKEYGILIMVAIPLVAICLAFVPVFDLEARIRWIGWLLQILGILTVAVGVNETRKQFNQPSLLQHLQPWLRRWIPSERIEIEARDELVVGLEEMRIELGKPEILAGDPVEVLQRQVAKLSWASKELRRLLHEEANKREQMAREQRGQWQAADQVIAEQLKGYATGGLVLASMGVVWLVVGVTMSTIVPDVACVFAV